MLDRCQTFKAAFLAECLAQGLSLEETHLCVKQACDSLQAKEAGWWDAVKGVTPGLSTASALAQGLAGSTGKALPGLGLGLGLAATVGVPAAVGGAAGYGVAQLEGMNDEDPDEIMTQEKIDAYRRAGERAILQKKLRQLQNSRRPSRPML